MPVDHQHKEYKENLPRWRTCRAVLGGGRKVKRPEVSKDIILPLSGHDGDEKAYNLYVQGAHVFPGAAAAATGFIGLLNEEPAQIDAPAGMKPFLENVTRNGAPVRAEEFIARVIADTVFVGRSGVLTNYPERPAGTPVPSQKEAERLKLYPKWVQYDAEEIWDWHEIDVSGRTLLAMLCLHERKEVPAPTAEDEHAWSDYEQWRMLDRAVPPPEIAANAMPDDALPPFGDGRVYRSRIYRKDEANPGKFLLVAESWPRMNGKLQTEIPWDWMGSEKGGTCVDKPPLEDAVEVNVGHIRNSAAREWGLLFTANPMPYLFGYRSEEEEPEDEDAPQLPAQLKARLKWRMGSSEILVLRNENAKADMLSAKAEDLGALKDAMQEKRDELTAVVGRILAQEKKAAEAAQTEELKREGEKGVLTALARVISAGMTRALERARDYMGLEGDVKVTISTEFFEQGFTFQEALALADLWTKYGLLAKSDVRQQLREAGIIPKERTDAQIDAEISREAPPTPTGLTPEELAAAAGNPPPAPGTPPAVPPKPPAPAPAPAVPPKKGAPK